MGFSLAGFGAGLAESIVSRIEEERKFSAAALQGRIERASIMKQQREKEQEALTEELRNRKNELVQFGIQDNDLQIAYLSSPMAFEALKKAQVSGLNVDPRKLITINQDKLFSGTADEFIAKAAAADQQVQPARVLPSEGRSMLAPSQSQEQRRLEQIASMRGMTLEDVARAESGVRPRMPEPAASINFAALQKEDKTQWPEKLKALETIAIDTATKYGKNSPEAINAEKKLNEYRTATREMTPEQIDYAKSISRAKAIVLDKFLNVSDADRKRAESFLREDEARTRRLAAENKKDDKIPATGSLQSLARNGGAYAVRSKFGAKAVQGLAIVNTPDGGKAVDYTGDDLVMQAIIRRQEQEGVLATLSPYLTIDGRVPNADVESTLRSFGIKLDKDRRPVLSEAPPMPAPPPAAGERRAQPKPPVAATPTATPTAAPTPGTGRAGQGAKAPTQDNFIIGKEYVDANGNRAIYRGNGNWEPVAR